MIRLIVPFPAGGATDFTAGVVAEGLGDRLGRSVRVEAHPGHYGIRAMQRLLASTPDAALLIGTVNTNSIAPVLHKEELPFDYDDVIVPISRLGEFPSVLATSTDESAADLRDLLYRLKSSTGQIRYSTDFLGTNIDVDMVMLSRVTGLELAYRSTNGALEILADLEQGRADLCILNVATMVANRGRYRPLAVTAAERLEAFPDVPTLREAGFPDVGTRHWQGLFGHGDMTVERTVQVHEAVVDVMSRDVVQDRFASVAALAVTSSSPDAFAAEITAEMTRWEKLAPTILSLREIT